MVLISVVDPSFRWDGSKLMKNIYYWIFGILAGLALVFFILIPAFAGRIFIEPAINLGLFQLRWYGLILAAAILASYLVIRKNSWRFGISLEDADDYAFWVVIAGVLGARIYYVLFSFSYFSQNIGEIYKIWHGGLSIYGGLIAGILFTYFFARKKAYSFWQIFENLTQKFSTS